MKKINILLVALCVVCIAANAIVINSLNRKLDNLNGRLNQLEMKMDGVRSSMSNFNHVQQNAEAKQKEVFTPSELSQYLGVEMSKVYEMIDAKGIGLPYVCIDGEYRFGREAIEEWLKSNKGTVINN